MISFQLNLKDLLSIIVLKVNELVTVEDQKLVSVLWEFIVFSYSYRISQKSLQNQEKVQRAFRDTK